MSPAPLPPLPRISYRLRDASAVTGVCTRVLRNAIDDGSLAAVYVGSRVFILATDLEGWMTARRSTSRIIVRPDMKARTSARNAAMSEGVQR